MELLSTEVEPNDGTLVYATQQGQEHNEFEAAAYEQYQRTPAAAREADPMERVHVWRPENGKRLHIRRPCFGFYAPKDKPLRYGVVNWSDHSLCTKAVRGGSEYREEDVPTADSVAWSASLWDGRLAHHFCARCLKIWRRDHADEDPDRNI